MDARWTETSTQPVVLDFLAVVSGKFIQSSFAFSGSVPVGYRRHPIEWSGVYTPGPVVVVVVVVVGRALSLLLVPFLTAHPVAEYERIPPQVVVVPRAQNDIDTDAIVNDLQEKWEAVENKPAAIIYATGALAGVWVANSVVGAINALPLLPKMFELVGLGYSAWFTYRYLLFKSNREELVDDIEARKKKIAGDN